MTSREEAMRLAASMGDAKITEDERSVIVSSMSDEDTSYTLNLKHSGYMTMGREAVPGVELEDGPVFGLWPGLGLVGELRDKEGNLLDSTVLGNEGITMLITTPEAVVNLVQAALSICMTGEQVDATMDVIYSTIALNQEHHTASRLVEQTHKMMAENEDEETVVTAIGEWEENDDPTGLLKVARVAGMSYEDRRAMYEAMNNPQLTQNQKMAKAKEFLAKEGINLIDYSQGAPDEVRGVIQELHAIGAIDLLGQDIREGISAVGISLAQILDKLPPEKAEELRRKLGDQLEGKEED